jgi:penicillin-binding protein 1A
VVVDAVRRYLVTEYGERAVYSGGLRVHTSLDPEMQTAAESVMAQTLGAPGDPHGAIVSVDPATGYVRALVGGRDGGEERFNIAIQGLRQPGSAFKPFVLAAALQSGMSPQERFSGPGTLCIPGWLPDCEVENYGGQGFGSLTLAEATWRSVNTVYAQLVMQVGADEAAEVARRMGIDGAVGERLGLQPHAIDPLPALALGSEEVTPLEMASAYATLAARGVWRGPTFVTSVRDRRGNVLEEGPPGGVRAIDEGVADEVTGILEGVITRGTGRQAAIGMPAAGKTGTASDYRNAWFVGYTPALSTAVWIGYREENRPLSDVHGVRNVTGGTLPAAMWSGYMRAALRNTAPASFPAASTTGPSAGPDASPGAPVASAAPEPAGPTASGGGDTPVADPVPTVGRRAAPPPATTDPQPSPAPPPGLGQLIGGVIGR